MCHYHDIECGKWDVAKYITCDSFDPVTNDGSVRGSAANGQPQARILAARHHHHRKLVRAGTLSLLEHMREFYRLGQARRTREAAASRFRR